MKKKTVAVYARVSTDKQKVDMQLQGACLFSTSAVGLAFLCIKPFAASCLNASHV